MSSAKPSPRAVRAPAKRRAAKPARRSETVSADARRLAATLAGALAVGKTDMLAPAALQALLAALCRVYSAQVEAGAIALPVAARSVNATEIMVTASGLLKSSNLAVFELGMWQGWTGR